MITFYYYFIKVNHLINLKGGENTKSKRLIIILAIFIMLLCINGVNASDIEDNSNNLAVNENQEVITADGDVGNFTELSNYVNAGNSIIELDKNYKYVEGDSISVTDGIAIPDSSSPLTINGNNHVIDGNGVARIFKILNYASSPVVLNDITFTNAGNGAIYSLNPHLTINNCTFENNYAPMYGSAVTIVGNNTQIINSTFKNNLVANSTFGGAVRITGSNVTVSGSTFENNNATNGGAINVGGDNCTIKYCTFEDNHAKNGGAIYASANNVSITDCKFTKNEATYNEPSTYSNHGGGGAILMFQKENLTVSNCIFEENTAKHTGGSIFIYGSNNTNINNSTFFNNTAVNEAAAIYLLFTENATVGYSNFTKNGAISLSDSYGGAIRVHECNNTLIHDSNFTANYANHDAGGAIEYNSDGVSYAAVENCNFDSNLANSDGGAMYIHTKGEFNITGCNFTNNEVIDNQNVKSGGAILINLKTEDNGTKAWNNALKTNIVNSNFINNTAPLMGGAICLRSHDRGVLFEENIIENCTFTGNNATWGSAIFLYTQVSANLTNVVFGKNRANSTSLDIVADKEKSLYPSNVTLTVTFNGKDNIANAIWNGGHHKDNNHFDPQNSSHVYLKNITYEVYSNGELNTVQVYQDELENPVNGYISADPGENIWQDTLENAQNITIEIYNIENNKMVANISALTEVNGSVSNIQMNLKPGNYTAKAYHRTDAYYTEASDSVNFEIMGYVVLEINKSANIDVVGNNSLINYTLTVKNNGVINATEVEIIDSLPENLTYTGKWGIIKNNGATINQISDLQWIVSEIPNGTDVSIWFTATVNTDKSGIITNVVTVTSKENKTEVKDNETVEVVPVVLTVDKTVDLTVVGNNSEVTFTIVVNNTSKVNASEVKVVDELPDGLVFVDATRDYDFSISDDNKTLTWVISEMGNNPVELFVTVRTSLVGNLTNNVTVTSKENDTPVKDNETVEVVPVVLTVDKTVDLTVVGNNSEVTFTIVVNNTSKVNARS